MICPRCSEGTIIIIRLRQTRELASLCQFCETMWYADEQINPHSGHTLRSYSDGTGQEHTLEEVLEEDQEHQSAEYKKYN
jgi:hypothetical protein